MDFGLNKKVVLVTGASSGIGQATAAAFGHEGSRVAITYHRNLSGGEKTAEIVRRSGGEAFLVHYDMTDLGSIEEAIGIVNAHWGPVEVLVNNAIALVANNSCAGGYSFEDIPSDTWKPVVRNLEGVFSTIQAVLPSMRSKGWGRIVNVSSNIAEDGLPGAGPYAAAKGGIHGLTAVLAVELGPAGILTNVVLPGLTLTERIDRLRSRASKEEIARATPTRRLTSPEDVAKTIVFLGSLANGNINGEAIRITGGL